MLPDWFIEKRALDGAKINDIITFQTINLPQKATTVVSAGGNDLLEIIDIIFNDKEMSYHQSIQSLRDFIDRFESNYSSLLNSLNRSCLCLTIYNPAFCYFNDFGKLSAYQSTCEISIRIFNDIIQNLTRKSGFDVLELRDLMTGKNDYSNSIEPSHYGGKKIASEISRWAKDFKLKK